MSDSASARPASAIDPRVYQILTLSCLLVYGIGWLDFEISLPRALLIVGVAQATQYACTRWFKLPFFDPKSAMISALSLCLLLRTNYEALAVFAAVFAVASKFTIRVNDKHIFNPTNGALVAVLLTGQGWVSPGQWGTAAVLAFAFACVGGLVVNRAERSDVTYAFLLFFGGIVFGRAWWLGDPWTIPVHQLSSGAFLLFAFFMISDPKTTPDSRLGRILFAGLVAFGAGYVQFRLFRTNGLIWSLGLFSLLVPLIDRLLPGGRYQWKGTSNPSSNPGDSHAVVEEGSLGVARSGAGA